MSKQMYKFIGISFVTIFIALLLTTKGINISLVTSLCLIFLFLLPGYLISSLIKNLSLVENYLLSILIGFGYTSIYFLLEVIFNLKLTKILFLIVPALIYTYFIYRYIRILGTKKEREI